MTESKNVETKMQTKMKEIGDRSYSVPLAIVIAGAMLSWAIAYRFSPPQNQLSDEPTDVNHPKQQIVTPIEGVTLPVSWGDLGLKLATSGAIDVAELEALYRDRGGFPEEYKKLLLYRTDGTLKITRENAGYLLNLFWALGLANKNPILAEEMMDERYGGPQNFASTAGWTIARGNPMDHYSKHHFISLTPDEQALVDKISKGIYRPCCNNSTHFPDCNHGMAMLGLLELMASQGVPEEEMWQTALVVNSYWFPDTYATIALYMESEGIDQADVPPQELLGTNYSSASGYAKVVSRIKTPIDQGGSSGCGVDIRPVNTSRKQVGCGV